MDVALICLEVCRQMAHSDGGVINGASFWRLVKSLHCIYLALLYKAGNIQDCLELRVLDKKVYG